MNILLCIYTRSQTSEKVASVYPFNFTTNLSNISNRLLHTLHIPQMIFMFGIDVHLMLDQRYARVSDSL